MTTDRAATLTERYLSHLCRRSFLRLWSWPSVYRDQHWSAGSVGKEVCDLLVVFDNHIFVFSDKYCAFRRTGDLNMDWARWLRKAVLKSARQVLGAARWIREHPDRLFLDPACSERFPIALPPSDKAVFHRVVVAHGAAAMCREVIGGSGSLMLEPNTPALSCPPFTIGCLVAEKYVHVVDDFTLDTILGTVDTVADLAQYLERKEKLILSGRLALVAGEENLLAYYLRRVDDEEKHCFDFPASATAIVVDDGHWDAFCAHPDRRSQIQADKISYAWDDLIDEFAKNILEGTEYFATEHTVTEIEPALRLMAGEPRLRRRGLAKSLLTVLERGDREWRAARVCKPIAPGEPYYVFITLQPDQDHSYEEYRIVRRELLKKYCLVTRLEFDDALDIVGIASEPLSSSGRSADFIYLDGRHWTDELAAEASGLQRDLGILEEMRPSQLTEHEYPRAWQDAVWKGRNRNKTCPCGSGRKFKKCHGAPS